MTERNSAGAEFRRRTGELLLGSVPEYTREQVAELAGVSVERATALWTALGFTATDDAEIFFTPADVEALRIMTGLRELGIVDEANELALTRTLGQAMGRLADWQLDTLTELVAVTDSAPDVTATTLSVAETLIEPMRKLQQYVWYRHLHAATGRLLHTTEPAETMTVAVGFADIVGFTSLSRGLDLNTLAEFLEEFEATTSAVIADHGARVIKMVGDEVMFVAAPHDAARIGLELGDRVSSLDGRPDLRVGLAYGPVLRRLGDAFGTVVNMASRLTALARPGTVLIDRELAVVLESSADYQLRRLRKVSVRGFEKLQPWLLRRA